MELRQNGQLIFTCFLGLQKNCEVNRVSQYCSFVTNKQTHEDFNCLDLCEFVYSCLPRLLVFFLFGLSLACLLHCFMNSQWIIIVTLLIFYCGLYRNQDLLVLYIWHLVALLLPKITLRGQWPECARLFSRNHVLQHPGVMPSIFLITDKYFGQNFLFCIICLCATYIRYVLHFRFLVWKIVWNSVTLFSFSSCLILHCIKLHWDCICLCTHQWMTWQHKLINYFFFKMLNLLSQSMERRFVFIPP